MKKIIVLLSAAVLGFSCSDDDDSSDSSSLSNTDVVGEWMLVSEAVAGEELPLDECTLMTKITFTETEFTEEDYGISSFEEECVSRILEFPYRIEGNELISTDFGEDGFEGELSVSGDQLTFDDEEIDGDEVFGSVRVFERVTE